MTAKEYLSKVIKLKKKAESLARKEEELRAKAEGMKAIVYDKDKVQVSAADRMPDAVAALVETQIRLATAIADCYEYIARCEDIICQIHSVKQAEVLRWRYIEDNNGRQYYFSEIAELMHIENVTSVIRLHKRAIRSFEGKLKNGTTM